MEYLPEFLTVALVHLLAVISPGPDFILITRNSMVYSRKTGIYSAIGLSLGILVHVAYSLAGIAILIASSVILFSAMKFIGAAYLIYIGYKSLKSKYSNPEDIHLEKSKDLTKLEALKMGFITNVTNPKATLFFLSLFTLVISPNTPLWVKSLYGVEMVIVQAFWFILVASVFSANIIKNKVAKFQQVIEKVMGGILILLGIKLAFTNAK